MRGGGGQNLTARSSWKIRYARGDRDISFEVRDFSEMKSVFDAAADARTEAGIAAEAFRNMDAPNNAWVIGTAPSKEAFTAFFRPQLNKSV